MKKPVNLNLKLLDCMKSIVNVPIRENIRLKIEISSYYELSGKLRSAIVDVIIDELYFPLEDRLTNDMKQ